MKKDFNLTNIYRVLIEEKKVLTDYLKVMNHILDILSSEEKLKILENHVVSPIYVIEENYENVVYIHSEKTKFAVLCDIL